MCMPYLCPIHFALFCVSPESAFRYQIYFVNFEAPFVKEELICDLFRVWDIRAAVAGVSHFVPISVFLVSVGNPFAVIQLI